MNPPQLPPLALLLEWLQDPTVPADLRDDAAMDLSHYDEPEAEQALLRLAADTQTEYIIAASCGESLAEIWHRQGRTPSPELLAGLHEAARAEIEGRQKNDAQRKSGL